MRFADVMQENNYIKNIDSMITKASIRRFLWRHCYDLHYLLYREKLNQEEKKELIDFIEKANRSNNPIKHQKQ